MTWTPVSDYCGGWYWYSEYFANGWCAGVADHTQSVAPKKTTSYTASAVCRKWIRPVPSTFDTFDAAKSAAVNFALQQESTDAR